MPAVPQNILSKENSWTHFRRKARQKIQNSWPIHLASSLSAAKFRSAANELTMYLLRHVQRYFFPCTCPICGSHGYLILIVFFYRRGKGNAYYYCIHKKHRRFLKACYLGALPKDKLPAPVFLRSW